MLIMHWKYCSYLRFLGWLQPKIAPSERLKCYLLIKMYQKTKLYYISFLLNILYLLISEITLINTHLHAFPNLSWKRTTTMDMPKWTKWVGRRLYVSALHKEVEATEQSLKKERKPSQGKNLKSCCKLPDGQTRKHISYIP